MLPNPELGSIWNHLHNTMYLYVLLACALWGLESRSVPMKTASTPLSDNHTAVCTEIRSELLADKFVYKGYFRRPQNTSEEPCYGKFTKDFISTLEELTKHNQKDIHMHKVYKDMKNLVRICTKLKPTAPRKKCITEISDFSKFKEALKNVVISIEGWKSCKSISDSIWDPELLPRLGTHG